MFESFIWAECTECEQILCHRQQLSKRKAFDLSGRLLVGIKPASDASLLTDPLLDAVTLQLANSQHQGSLGHRQLTWNTL